MTKITILLIAIFFSVPCFAQPCLQYDPAVVTLSGVLKECKAPNMDENGDGDPKGKFDKFIVIHLDHPICVAADSESTIGESSNGAESNVKEIQLVNMFSGKKFSSEFKRWRKLMHDGKPVKVSGKLYHADNGHQHTDVLIEVEKLYEP